MQEREYSRILVGEGEGKVVKKMDCKQLFGLPVTILPIELLCYPYDYLTIEF